MRSIEYSGNNNDYERKLINAVCKQIEVYIQQIKPKNIVYISFDGVAPVAKLNQQKNRRYKSWFINDYDKNETANWDSTAITPGTEFMNKMNLQIKYHFRTAMPFNVKQVIVSGSDSPGGAGGGGKGTGSTGCAGTANTGGGGGGAGNTPHTGGAGGSGIIVIRYKFQ